MDKPNPLNLVDRAALIESGNSFKKEMSGLSDLQILSFLETIHIVEFCETMPVNDAYRLPSLRLLGLIFDEFRGEILAEPPTLSFEGLAPTPAEEPLDPLTKQFEAAIDHWKSARDSRIQAALNTSRETSTTSVKNPLIMTPAQNTGASGSTSQVPALSTSPGSSTDPANLTEANGSDAKATTRKVKSSASTAKAPPRMSEAHSMFGTNTKAQDRGIKLSEGSSRSPITMTRADSPSGSSLVIQSDSVVSSVPTTKARTDWEPSKSDDPFGVRVSTEEFGSSQPPFELANTGKFQSVRDNILYDSGYREATAHFEHLPAQIVQPPQPGVDLTPEPVKAYIAANNRSKEAAKAEMQTVKAKELNVVGAQEITTARGLREDFTNVDPTYTDTMFAAIEAAKLETSPDAAWDKLSNEALRELRAELKAKGKDSPPITIKEEEYKAQSSACRSPDAPTEEDELSAKSWTFPVADSVIEKAQMQYDMMYQIVTQMQRERLELGPEISDYEVIARAHASYVTTDEKEAAALARAAETQKVKALALSITEELLRAQANGHALTNIGGLDLTQKDIAQVLERCRHVGGSSSAALDYINAQTLAATAPAPAPDLYVDLHPTGAAATKPATIGELVAGARIGIAENSNNNNHARASSRHFDAAVATIERDLAAMKTFKSKIGTTPRDFGKEIAEIQLELAALKAHRAAYPGDPADLVPDGVDAKDYVGIAVRSDDYGTVPEAADEADEGSSAAAAAAPAAARDKDKDKKPSRAEQRRVARQKAKGKGKA